MIKKILYHFHHDPESHPATNSKPPLTDGNDQRAAHIVFNYFYSGTANNTHIRQPLTQTSPTGQVTHYSITPGL
jgi:hypothetical protein